jgi:hypothetical protein
VERGKSNNHLTDVSCDGVRCGRGNQSFFDVATVHDGRGGLVMQLINTSILFQPMNWLTVAAMGIIFCLFLHVVFSYHSMTLPDA